MSARAPVDSQIEGYLSELGRRLAGDSKFVPDIVDELRDHLLEATQALRAQGIRDGEAVTRAIGELGPPAQVAESLWPVTAERRLRGTAHRAVLVSVASLGIGMAAFVLVPILNAASLDPGSMPGLLVCQWVGRLGLIPTVAMVVLSRHPSLASRDRRSLPLLLCGVMAWLVVLANTVVAPLFLERAAIAYGTQLALPWMAATAIIAGALTALSIRPLSPARLVPGARD